MFNVALGTLSFWRTLTHNALKLAKDSIKQNV